MVPEKDRQQASEQLDRAKETLGEALGLTQDISKSGNQLDVEEVNAALAKSIRRIFDLQTAGLTAPNALSLISGAMDSLRRTLGLLQDVRSTDAAIEKTTGTVARTLALLYPVLRLVEDVHHTPDEGRLRVTDPDKVVPRTSSLPGAESVDVAKERRESERHIMEVDIGIHSGTNFYAGFSQDISSGGIFVSTYDTLPVGSLVNVNFNLPGGPIFCLDGTVRWVKEYNEITPETVPGMGIRFENLTEDDTETINEFMDQCPPLFYE